MKWAYDLTGAEPIIRDEIVYDATAIADGELLMLAAAADFTVGTGFPCGLITAYSTTVASAHAVDSVGISLEAKTTANSPSIATVTDTTAEPCYVKTIINPFAVYRAECVTSEQRVITSWTTTHLVIAGSASVDNYMSWIYFSASAGPNFGELRMIVDTPAADTINVSSNVAVTATTADKVIYVLGKNQISNGLDTTAVGVTCQSSGTPGVASAVGMRIVETWMDSDAGFEVMHQHKHYSGNKKKGGGKAAKFYYDIVLKDHAFNSID